MSLGSLIATLGIDTANWIQGLTKAEYQMAQFQKSVTKGVDESVGKLGELAVALVSIHEAMELLNKTAEYAAQLEDLSYAAGTSVEAMDKMALTFKLMGIGAEQTGKIVEGFSKTITAASDPASKAAQQYAALGVSITHMADGSINVQKTLDDTLAALARIPDAALRNDAAMALLGKGGKEVALHLGDLAEASKLASDQIEKNGTVSEEAAKAGQAFERQMALTADTMIRVSMPAMVQIQKGLADISNAFGSNGPQLSDFMSKIGGALVIALKVAADAVMGTVTAFKELGTVLGFVGAALNAYLTGNWRSIPDMFKAMNADLDATDKGMQKFHETLWDGTAAHEANAKATDFDAKSTDNIRNAFNGSAAAADALNKKLETMAQHFLDLIAEGAGTSGWTAKTSEEIRKLDQVYAAHKLTLEQYGQALDKILAMDANRLKEQKEIDKEHVDEMNKAIAADEKRFQSTEKYIDALDKGNEKLKEQINTLGVSKLAQDIYNTNLEREAQLLGVVDAQQIIDINQKADRRIALLREADAAEVSNEALKKQGDMYQQLADYGMSFFEKLAGGAKSTGDAVKQLGADLKKYVLDQLYQAVLKPFVIQLAGSFAGMMTSGTAAGSTGGTGGLGSLFGSSGSNFGFGQGFSLMDNTWASSSTSLGNAAGGGMMGMGVGALAAQFLGNNRNQQGMQIGGTVGGAIGSIWGPIGAMVGSLIGTAIGSLIKSGGGPKSGGFASTDPNEARYFTPSDMDAKMQTAVEGIGKSYADLIKGFGGTSKATFGLGFDTDPKGTAPNRISAGATVNGVQVYKVSDLDVGTDPQRLQDRLALEANRAVLAALQASDLPKDLADILNAVGAATATQETIDKMYALADGVTAIDKAMASIGDINAAIAKLADSSVTSRFYDQGAALQDLLATYDGSIDATNALNTSAGAYYASLLQLETAVYNVTHAVDDMFANTADAILSTGKDASWMIEHLNDDATATFAQLASQTDPSKIQAMAQKINDDINKAWNLLTPEEQDAQRGTYLESIQKVNDAVAAQLKQIGDAAAAASKGVFDDVRTALLEAAANMATAANNQNVAANLQVDAANSPLKIDVKVDAPATVTVNG